MFVIKGEGLQRKNVVMENLGNSLKPKTKEYWWGPKILEYSFLAGAAKMVIDSPEELDLAINSKSNKLPLVNFSRKEKSIELEFALDPSHAIRFEYPVGFHSLLNSLLTSKDLELPEEAKAYLSYDHVPIGASYLLPKEILRNLQNFRMMSNSDDRFDSPNIAWDKEGKASLLDVVEYSLKNTEKGIQLEEALIRTGLIKKMTEQGPSGKKSKLILEKEMTPSRFHDLEWAVAGLFGSDTKNYFEGEYVFSGMIKVDTLRKLPQMLDNITNSHSEVKFPKFTVKMSSSNHTSLNFARGDLETPARVAQVMAYNDMDMKIG